MKSIKPKVTSTDMKNFSLRISAGVKRIPLSLELEITARCNLNCKHCYINLRANDEIAKRNELSKEDIKEIIDESISLGAISCTLTGGEPLLRGDFIDIYLYLKKKGILVSVFTNATL
ncbi:MAG: radical SAM protein, partial [Promethearchaeati archaeon]